ncbi:MAG TPA: TatD family hydrolase [Candidatus Limnocylindria bacterium]|nr:TatD family hydrolase [Candidatus Limnocylindria bacterium]
MIDTHCHLADQRFDKDRAQVFDRARVSSVTHFVEIAYAPEIVPRAQALAREHPNLFLCVGVHPSESGRVADSYLETLRDHARHPRVVAIGETGLDFYRDHASPADQERWFRAQIALADELGLPVVIHQRSALEPTLRILEETRPSAGGVLHCFDDGAAALERAERIGFKLGLGGVLTYGHAALDEAVRNAPEAMLVLETDAPYLEPEPRSLRRNEPGLLTRVLPRLCELRGWTPEHADRSTTANARDLFRLPIAAEPSGSA